MNLLLLKEKESVVFLSSEDRRVKHLREVLRMGLGSQFYVGVENGPRGKAVINEDDGEGMKFEIEWERESQKVYPITLVVGLPRPQIGRRILEECTGMGVARILFFSGEKGESSYGDSKLWRTDEWQRCLVKGAEQAFSTTIPEVRHFKSLSECLEFLGTERKELEGVEYIGLDNYEAEVGLGQAVKEGGRAYVVALGPERGWSKGEREILRKEKFILAHLGERVLKLDVACVVTVGIIREGLRE